MALNTFKSGTIAL